MRHDQFLFIFVVAVFALTLIMTYSVVQAQKTEIKKLNVIYEISDRAGFNLEKQELNFGRLIPGNKATRTINIHNSENESIKVSFVPSVNLKKIITYKEGESRILPKESMNFSFTLIIPIDMVFGNYTGFVEAHISK